MRGRECLGINGRNRSALDRTSFSDCTIRRGVLKYLSDAVAHGARNLQINMPLLSRPLPEYTGPHKVGLIDIEVPCERRTLDDVVFRGGRKPVFEPETVLFSLYYPAEDIRRATKSHLPWISNMALQAEGFARFAKIDSSFTTNLFNFGLWSLIGSTTIPAHVDVPLSGTGQVARHHEAQQPLQKHELRRLPVIVFSHGMASSRTSYTQYCGEMASRGYVVAAIEHRDGSGPGTEIHRPDGPPEARLVISRDELDPVPDEAQFKIMQLAMREAEVEATVHVLRMLNNGQGDEVAKANAHGYGVDYLPSWADRLDMKRIVMAGHSYGATLALQALKGAPSAKLPFVGGIALDPGKHSGPLNDDIRVPLLVIHSQSWSSAHSVFHGRPHFEVVKDLVGKVMQRGDDAAPKFAWFLTAKGTTHPSVTDAPLIEPLLLSWTTGSTISAKEGVLQSVKASEELMQYLVDGKLRGVLAEEVTHSAYDKDVRSTKRKKEMNRSIRKYWQIHTSPATTCAHSGPLEIVPERGA